MLLIVISVVKRTHACHLRENGVILTYNYHNTIKNHLLNTLKSNILSTFVYDLDDTVERIEEKNILNNNFLSIK